MEMLEYAAKLYIWRTYVRAYAITIYLIICAIIGITVYIVSYIKRRHNENPMTFFLEHPNFAHSCLNDKEWVKRNPNFALQLQKKLEKHGL